MYFTRKLCLTVGVAIGICVSGSFSTQAQAQTQRPSFFNCYYESAQKYRLPPELLIAISYTESNFNVKANGKNKGGSEDHGLMQINSSWLPKLRKQFGIDLAGLYEPCTNIEVGAWVLAHNIQMYGWNWNAVGAYNAKSPHKREIYIKRVAKNLEKFHRGEL